MLQKIFHFFIDTLQTILVAAAAFLVIYAFFFRPFQVNGQSMFPTFENGENILTNLIILRFEEPKKGDVIVFKAPLDAEKDFIKRVMAVPNDTISIRNGKVFVNGEFLDESAYLDPSVQTYGGGFLKNEQTVTVPDNSYFVMGDNRQFSSDSREWGFVPKKDIIGHSWIVYWPLDKLSIIKNPFEKN